MPLLVSIHDQLCHVTHNCFKLFDSHIISFQVLAAFYFAIPVGTGLGYIVGSEVASVASDWRWGLRVTPFLGILAIIGLVFFLRDPPRGESEGAGGQDRPLVPKDLKEDLRALARNKSFVLSTCAFTCVTFSAGKNQKLG